MKIVSWNCRGGFYSYKKYKNIIKLDADIYVIQEINCPKNIDAEYKEFIENHIPLLYDDEDTSGKNKGIAIIAKEGIDLKCNNWDYEYNDFLSVRVDNSFNLVGVWTHDRIKVDGEWVDMGNKVYLDRMEKYLELHSTDFKNSDNLIMCGDFNIDISLPEQKGRDEFNKLLNKYGYKSIYHYLHNEELGEESIKTFYRDDGNLHMDYLFTKPELVTSFKIGSKEEYIGPAKTDKSDHVPLIFEVDL